MARAMVIRTATEPQPDGEGYRELALAVIAKAVADMEAEIAHRDRVSAARFLAGKYGYEDSLHRWAEMAGVSPEAVTAAAWQRHTQLMLKLLWPAEGRPC